ncbi:MAG TPA: TIR domain-containing protein [Anaerolineales bacterium]|nr:TIR domain-containing protein [Anaerolineales bacterium]
MANETQRKTFLSYSRVNKDFALKLAKELKSEGFDVWLDQLDIPPGARWDAEVEKALAESEIFMIIITPASAKSENVLDEIGYAIDSGKRILPVLLETATIPLRLRRFQYVDFTSKSFHEGIESAKELLRTLINQPTLLNGEVQAETQTQAERETISPIALSVGMKGRNVSTAPSQKKPLARELVIGLIAVVVLGIAGIGYGVLSKGGSSNSPADGPTTIPATEISVIATSTIALPSATLTLVQPTATVPPTNTPESAIASVPINADAAIQAAFVQSAMSGDMTGRNLYIDKEKHPLASERDMLVFAMPNYKSPEPPSDYPGVYYDYPVSVWFTGTQWSIVKISGMESIPWKTAFNVQILAKDSNANIHTATAENTSEYWTVIDSEKFPLASDPNALVFATFNLSASAGRGKYFDKPIGVAYKDGQWIIYNRDLADMPEGAAFNVQIVNPDTPGTNAFIYKVESPVDNWTIIKNPNGTPIIDANALIFAMPRGTLEGNGVKYDQNIGVWLNDSMIWVIFNQKKTIPMPEGAEFNILILEPK